MKSQTSTTTSPDRAADSTATAATASRPTKRSTAERLLEQFPARLVPPVSPATTATIDEVNARIRLAQFRSPRKGTNTARRRGARLLLEWLQSFPGDTWQQRWDSSNSSKDPSDWALAPLNWLGAQGIQIDKNVLQSGLLILTIAEVIHLDLAFTLSLPRIRHWGSAVAAHRDSAGFERLQAAADGVIDSPHDYDVARWQIAMLVLAKSGGVGDITVGDCIELRQLEVALKLKGARRHQFYTLVRNAGDLPPGAPTTLRAITAYSGQHSVEELIDRYHLANRDVRNLLVYYLAERQPALDYISLEALSRALGLYFWKNLETHHPGIDSLQLKPEVAAAWKDRLRSKTTRKRLPDGSHVEITSARAYYGEIVTSIRAFYLDIAQWATEDPGRWARWAVPSPIRASEISFKKANSRRKARMDQRTRARLPVLPTLVRAAEQHAQEARLRLDAVLAARPGESFTILGETFIKAVPERQQGPQAQTTIVTDSNGRKRRLREAENRAFWGWAAVEFLRHTGVRIEEMLETSHHSITQYRLPTTSEIIPLLHIAPSKTDEERLLVSAPNSPMCYPPSWPESVPAMEPSRQFRSTMSANESGSPRRHCCSNGPLPATANPSQRPRSAQPSKNSSMPPA
ncbi:site-specific integrase [Nocardia miyunensis]|uniref:site-specific integrase n=1 Tax=Nocardia miyunensis TaxID=282684 RepID=UPI000AF243DD|nr:site-specific integrase [Nocardia miyunensis]